jgi:hypothetical protein
MARPANTVETLSMTITVTPQVKQYLEDLVMKGTFGQSPAEIVRGWVNAKVTEHIDSGRLKERKWKQGADGKMELDLS